MHPSEKILMMLGFIFDLASFIVTLMDLFKEL